MYDDGTHGDQSAGDHVWSYSASFSPGTKIIYVYTNSGREGEWEGLDVPHIRFYKIEEEEKSERIYRPIETFGEIHMQADGWHTNSAGYNIIAEALLTALKENMKVKAYLTKAEKG